jgi:hypothetical protein
VLEGFVKGIEGWLEDLGERVAITERTAGLAKKINNNSKHREGTNTINTLSAAMLIVWNELPDTIRTEQKVIK